MLSRRFAIAAVTAFAMAVLAAGPTAARKPVPPAPTAPLAERPLTPEELAASDRKVAAAEAYIARLDAAGANLVTLACVTPQAPSASIIMDACSIPQGFLSVEARDQLFGHYCGPAAGQVIANYAWAMGVGANKYTQGKIAGWMATDVNGLTNAPELEDGLELATAGAPRRPAGWDWVVTPLRDADADGALGDQLQDFVRSNVSGSKMPLAIPVKPYDPDDRFHLSSWASPVSSPGHWIAIYGWYSNWTGTDFARVYYTDSSKDEGGSTGKFWDPTRHIAEMIRVHTGRFVW